MRASSSAPAERRREVRHAVTQVAKIRIERGREELCLLRDISAEGLRAQVYHQVELDEQVMIELRSGHGLSGRVIWAADGQIGVAFASPVPVAQLLAHCSFDERLSKLRPPRLDVDLFGILHLGPAQRVVRIGNISQAGVQIGAPEPIDANSPCAISLPGLAPRPAMVRWCRDGKAGLMLDEPLDYSSFAAWRMAIAA